MVFAVYVYITPSSIGNERWFFEDGLCLGRCKEYLVVFFENAVEVWQCWVVSYYKWYTVSGGNRSACECFLP